MNIKYLDLSNSNSLSLLQGKYFKKIEEIKLNNCSASCYLNWTYALFGDEFTALKSLYIENTYVESDFLEKIIQNEFIEQLEFFSLNET